MMACSHCGEEKSLSEFHRAKGRPNDRHPQCKICRSGLSREAALEKGARLQGRMDLFERGLQRCAACEEVKDLESFYRCSRSKTGRKSYCVPCYKRTGSEYRSKPETREAYRRKWRERRDADPEKYQEQQRNSTLRSKYGIDLSEYNEMLSSQGGRCAICEEPPVDGALLYVDHCHASGNVRQLLCHPCNAGLGFFRDRPDLLARAQAYVSTHANKEAS